MLIDIQRRHASRSDPIISTCPSIHQPIFPDASVSSHPELPGTNKQSHSLKHPHINPTSILHHHRTNQNTDQSSPIQKSIKQILEKMNSDVLDVLNLIPEALEKMILFPSPETGHHAENSRGTSVLTFPVDIAESPSHYVFYLDVPGVPKSEIQVTVEEERVLVISSNRKRKREEENGKSDEEGCRYLRLERRMPLKLMRKFRLPEDADVSGISARCENGVLSVNVKKLPPPPKPKTVQISVS